MQLQVDINHSKMLADYWTLLLPLKAGKLQAKGKYAISSTYGRMGEAECVQLYTCMLSDLKPMVLAMHGDMDYVARAKEAYKLMALDVVQVGVFRFLRRSDSAFHLMMKDEMRRKGIPMVEQPVLFAGV